VDEHTPSNADFLQDLTSRVGPLQAAAQAAARQRLESLTKPPGSLGRLERLAVQIVGITGHARPKLSRRTVVVMAADHGVTVEGVSGYPSSVTAEMVRNFVRGGAAINVLARLAHAEVVIVDIGVAADFPRDLPIRHRKIAYGTANLSQTAAMTLQQARAAIGIGIDVLEPAASGGHGPDVVCLGEMGIGNTTAASAIVASLTGLPPAAVTGRGTGIDDATWVRKVSVIERALALHRPDVHHPFHILASLGGLEIAGLVGVVLGAAVRRIPVLVDGFIATAAALLAVELCPSARNYLIAAHRSVEVGHQAALERLELEPLFALDLRLGEGTGAALALPILDAGLALLDEMATFEEAGVARQHAIEDAAPAT
jgi:nicotinate-nucleotide--dimethylbenzimidazole phosphoribosyltransferase